VHPLLQDGKHPNLHVLCESKVVHVLFDENKKAVGVEYTPNPEYQITTTQHPRMTVKARKMVVVSCGALGSPLVLERSGIGSKDVLEKAGVPVVADVPGVGEDYQDHNLIFYPYQTDLRPDETLDALWSGRMAPEEVAGKGLLGWNDCDIHAKYRPTEEEVNTLSPEFQKAWEKDYKGNPNKPLMLMAAVNAYVHSSLPPLNLLNPLTFMNGMVDIQATPQPSPQAPTSAQACTPPTPTPGAASTSRVPTGNILSSSKQASSPTTGI
jgi:alcohol oxidase